MDHYLTNEDRVCIRIKDRSGASRFFIFDARAYGEERDHDDAPSQRMMANTRAARVAPMMAAATAMSGKAAQDR
jgi:hypothetical protein